MKVRKEKLTTKPTFKPYEIVLTVENESEEMALYCVFNFTPITETIKKIAPSFASEVIRTALGSVDYHKVWTNFVGTIRNHPRYSDKGE